MNLLTTLNNIHDAEEILQWLSMHGVKASIEGKHSAAVGVFIPNGLSIQIHNQEQLVEAVRLLKKLEKSKSRPIKKETLLTRLRKKNIDQVFVGLVTLLLATLAVWVIYSVVG